MKVKVKICGVRTTDAAKAAAADGADFVGLNFVPSSKRLISVEKAQKIAEAVKGKIKVVGVFQNQESEYINNIVKKLGLEFVQLHGSEDSEFAKSIKAKIIKSFSTDDDEMDKKMFNYPADYFLLDRKVQGEGELADLEQAKKLAGKFNIFLAGGLDPENVSDRVSIVKPFAVDVASGVETEGRQDMEKIKEFIENAKGAVA